MTVRISILPELDLLSIDVGPRTRARSWIAAFDQAVGGLAPDHIAAVLEDRRRSSASGALAQFLTSRAVRRHADRIADRRWAIVLGPERRMRDVQLFGARVLPARVQVGVFADIERARAWLLPEIARRRAGRPSPVTRPLRAGLAE